MIPRERVLAALNHDQPDRCPCDYFATPEINRALQERFGETANMQAGLGYAFSNAAENGFFARAYGRFTAYRPFGERCAEQEALDHHPSEDYSAD